MDNINLIVDEVHNVALNIIGQNNPDFTINNLLDGDIVLAPDYENSTAIFDFKNAPTTLTISSKEDSGISLFQEHVNNSFNANISNNIIELKISNLRGPKGDPGSGGTGSVNSYFPSGW